MDINQTLIDEAAKWIEENIPYFVSVQPDFQDCPQEVILSEYCIDSFKEHMNEILENLMK